MKIAVFFPGIGYTNDKPLLYYSRKITRAMGYEEICVEYHDLPGKVKGDKEKMMLAANMAYEQAKERLAEIDFHEGDEVVFVGKSIGTILAARIAQDLGVKVKLVLYTPVEETFKCDIEDALAFIGTKDPWSSPEEVKRLAQMRNVPLHLYDECNHSLECGNTSADIDILSEVMRKTGQYIMQESGEMEKK